MSRILVRVIVMVRQQGADTFLTTWRRGAYNQD